VSLELAIDVPINILPKSTSNDDTESAIVQTKEMREIITDLLARGISKIRELEIYLTNQPDLCPARLTFFHDIKLESIFTMANLLKSVDRLIVNDIREGGILFKIQCPNMASLWDIQMLCRSERLHETCTEALIPSKLRDKFEVKVSVDEAQFEYCRQLMHRFQPSSKDDKVHSRVVHNNMHKKKI
jgi:hypothetical protein